MTDSFAGNRRIVCVKKDSADVITHVGFKAHGAFNGEEDFAKLKANPAFWLELANQTWCIPLDEAIAEIEREDRVYYVGPEESPVKVLSIDASNRCKPHLRTEPDNRLSNNLDRLPLCARWDCPEASV